MRHGPWHRGEDGTEALVGGTGATGERRFDERLGGLVVGILIFGVGVGWLAWQMFIAGGNPHMILQFMNPTNDNPIAWAGLLLGGFMVLLGTGRLLFARDVVILEPDRVTFGYGGRKTLPRSAVSSVEVMPPDAVRLHLRDRLDETTRRRAGVKDPQQTWVPIAGRFHEGEQLPDAVTSWFVPS